MSLPFSIRLSSKVFNFSLLALLLGIARICMLSSGSLLRSISTYKAYSSMDSVPSGLGTSLKSKGSFLRSSSLKSLNVRCLVFLRMSP